MLRVLSYNIAYEVTNPEQISILNEKGSKSHGINVVCHSCIDNIIKKFNLLELDVICLQETEKFDLIMKNTKFKNFNYYNHASGKDNCTIIWNPKVLSNPSVIRGTQFTIGRPMQIMYFNFDKLLLLNIHPGHKLNEYKRIPKLLLEREKELFKNKNNKVVICGDFNQSLKPQIKILTRTFYPHQYLTCCDKTLENIELHSHNFDHILLSEEQNEVKVLTEFYKHHSDHLPVYSEVKI